MELALAVMLFIPGWAGWWGALAALALFTVFTAVVAANLLRGRTPDCHCFGQLRAGPIGRTTLMRNLALTGLAALLVWQGPVAALGSPGSYLLGLAALVVVALLALLVWMVFNLLRQNGRLLLRVEALERHVGLDAAATSTAPGLPVGTLAPAFSLPDRAGSATSLEALLARGKPVLLIFLSATCAPCLELLPEIAQWQRDHQRRLTIVPIGRGDGIQSEAATHAVADMLLQADDNAVAAAYGIEGTPSAVLIRPTGQLATPSAGGTAAVRELVIRSARPADLLRARLAPPAAAGAQHATTLPIGDSAPVLRLPDLDGQPVDIAPVRGEATVLLFWNPACSYCRRMLPDLRQVLAQPNRPHLLVISRGSAHANRLMQLDAPILLDDEFSAGTAFGATGTPAAIQIDEQGKIASPMTAGATSVLDLLRRAAGEPEPDIAATHATALTGIA